MKTSIHKAFTVFIAVSMIISLAACASSSTGSTVSSTSVTTAQIASTGAVTSTTAASAKEKTTVTAAVTTTASEITTAASVSATTAEPTWKETKKSAEMYLNTSVYSRTKAYLGAPTANLYQINDKVKVVAVTDTDYYKLDNGKFIHCDYLSEKKTIIQTTVQTTTTAPPATTAPAVSTVKKNDKPVATNGKYISSGYAPLDENIQPILDTIITKKMNDTQKLKAVYDYLMQSSYIERTVLIPQDKKQYSEQIYACFILDNRYGVCYDFTSAFKYMTRALGFDTRMIYGYHTNPAGGASEHSWTELDIKGATYIFDPAIEQILISETGFTAIVPYLDLYEAHRSAKIQFVSDNGTYKINDWEMNLDAVK
ncbi:MAG: transglutaminase domain-containing protein [Ruminiclostridium sp.]|nr:transglutaminase domain-containing protein [Ruminiclostridium sp.]